MWEPIKPIEDRSEPVDILVDSLKPNDEYIDKKDSGNQSGGFIIEDQKTDSDHSSEVKPETPIQKVEEEKVPEPEEEIKETPTSRHLFTTEPGVESSCTSTPQTTFIIKKKQKSRHVTQWISKSPGTKTKKWIRWKKYILTHSISKAEKKA